jgi:hypothetical protein
MVEGLFAELVDRCLDWCYPAVMDFAAASYGLEEGMELERAQG